MPTVKVQKRKVTAKGKEYRQYWIGLPKSIAEAMQISKGDSLDVFIEREDLVHRLVSG